MKNIFSVGQINRYVKNMFTQDFILQKIYVKGEVSNCKYHTSGHIYFSLKDETGVLSCIMFAGHRRGLAFRMKDGDRVVMIEDVTTSGKSMEETVPKVKGAADVEIVGLMVSLDRMEVGKGGVKCALDEVKDLYGFETNAIVTMADVVEHLYNRPCQGRVLIDDTCKAAIDAYYEQYGAK